MPKWLITRHRHHCGRCNETIEAGAVACMVTLPHARVTVWRCASCWPPPDTVTATEAPIEVEVSATFTERLRALASWLW